DAVAAEDIHHAVHGIALTDATRIHVHGGVETHRACGGVEMDVLISDAVEHRPDLGAVRDVFGSLIEPPHFHQWTNCDVEGALALPAVVQARVEQLVQL